jgi:hypothetical protein
VLQDEAAKEAEEAGEEYVEGEEEESEDEEEDDEEEEIEYLNEEDVDLEEARLANYKLAGNAMCPPACFLASPTKKARAAELIVNNHRQQRTWRTDETAHAAELIWQCVSLAAGRGHGGLAAEGRRRWRRG